MKSGKFQLPDPQECAILLLLLARSGGNEAKEITRFRLSEITLKRLWLRTRITEDLLRDVQEWLARAGWAIFYAGGVYAMVRVDVVENWVRLSSKRLAGELAKVETGNFDFEKFAHLIARDQDDSDD
ncbi:hypothetical protein L6654_19505 [Bradyrhizobium sp. WYCCWR 13023]|uniref:Uncharacterized protein n=1 Tax=Bradyrhizobium zhengyangense TaxID=2911009 RepID=A0A9X1RBE1_9BRAD|nr:hypothetical protein [Bradyrhizobium zhengyangense]MCG2628826.1 hypothetical protein [Bradyrhizobium zhengyangense]